MHSPHHIHLDPIHVESMKRNKTLNINVNAMKKRPIKISMAMERGEVVEMPEIAEGAEMPGIAEMPVRNCRTRKCQK